MKKLCLVVVLLICLLLVSSGDAQLTLKGDVLSKPIGEIKPIREQGTAGQASTSGQAGPTVINFDDLVTGGWGTGGPISVTNQYSARGVTFNNARAIDYSKGMPIPGFAHSGNIALEACYGSEFCTAPIEIDFNQPQSFVKVWTGVDTKSTANQQYTVTLRAFDASGNQIGQDTKTLDATQGIVPIQTPLQVSSSTSGKVIVTRSTIVRATVSFMPLSDYYNNGLALDDVEFESTGIVVPTVGPARQA
jgi:hypothetical protein